MDKINSLSGPEGAGMLALRDEKTVETVSTQLTAEQAIVAFVKDRFQKAKTHRMAHELRWQMAWRNFRGQYGPEMAFTETEKSRVFVKVTKTKTMAAVGQVLDILFAGNKFPLSVEASQKPVGVAESVTISTGDATVKEEEENQEDDFLDIISPYGYPQDGQEKVAGRTVNDILGPTLAKRLAKIKDKLKIKEGEGTGDKGETTLHPAADAAANMENTMMDQLDECNASVHLRKAVLEMCALGTGCIRGALSKYKTYHQWIKNKETGQKVYTPIRKLMPTFKSRSIWHIFPDPDCTSNEDLGWVVDRHGLSRFQLRDMTNKPGFRKNVIENILIQGTPDYTLEWYENILRDDKTQINADKYEVLEYWGTIDKSIAEEYGMVLDPNTFTKDVAQISVNAYICNGRVIRLVLNPMTPSRIPYMLVPYEINPYQIWGIGVPENMEDSQMIMNGHARMAIDNLALAGNLVFEIDELALAPGEDLRIYPGRIFKRRSGAPGQSIFGTKFPSTANENMQMFDKFRQLADDQTGIPSVTHGQTGVSGTGRTSSGMSMVMSAAGVNIKTVVKNVDDFMIKPIGESLFAWNMQFNPDDSIVGDLEIKARGTSSLMLKEVRSQRLMMFMQVASQPMFAPLIKWETILTDIAKALEIDPKKLINSPSEARLQALLLRDFVGAQGEQAQPGAGQQPLNGDQGAGGQGGLQEPAPGPAAESTPGVGGGSLGTGTPSMPGEAGFTGNP